MKVFSENIKMDIKPEGSNSNKPEEPVRPPLLTSIEVTDQNVALNLIVSFLGLAQKRGAFTIDESAKIWECISRFRS